MPTSTALYASETPVLMHARLARLCTHKDLAWSSTTLDRALALGQNTRGARGCWSTSVHFDQTPYTSETLVALARKRTRFTTYQYASFDHRNRPTRLSEPAGGELGLARLTHLPPIVADPMEQWLCSMKMWPDGQTRPPAILLTLHSWSE